VHRRKDTDVDLGVELVLSLWSLPKEVMQEINAELHQEKELWRLVREALRSQH
jgi:hypothetical protein